MNRKPTNTVHLEGLVEKCLMDTRKEDGQPVARLTVVVSSLKDDGGFEHERHEVQVLLNAETSKMMEDLSVTAGRAYDERRLTPDKRSVDVPYCRLDGNLRSLGNSTFVECVGSGVELCMTASKDRRVNNRTELSGEVKSTSYSNKSVRATVDTGVALVWVFGMRDHIPEFWDGVSTGDIARGKGLSVSGRLVSNTYEGANHDRIYESVVSPARTKSFALDLKKTAARGL